MDYNHGIRVMEQETALAAPVSGTSGLQVVFGTAPINLTDDPHNKANKLFLCNSFNECTESLGYSTDFKKYTLCQSMDASFKIFNVAPIVLCNVLDPKVHKKENTAKEYVVKARQAIIDVEGILKDTVKVKVGEDLLEIDTDYVLAFNTSGYLIVALLETGAGATAASVNVESISVAPEMVTAEDIVGGYDVVTGIEKGLEQIRNVYPRFGLTAGLLLAPGWSHYAVVGAVMAAKCEEINGVFKSECLIDLDSSKAGAIKYTDCKNEKEKNGFISTHTALLWPQIKAGDKQYAFSAIFAALAAYTDAANDNVPNLSPSNKIIGIEGTVLEDGTEVSLDQQQANTLNGQGIITAINMGGWKSWGNNTACYPENKDPKDRWLCCRRFFTWWGNSFVLAYAQKVDNPTNHRLIESICDAENIRGNSYTAQGKCAGAKIVFNQSENPIENILNGKIQFHQYLAPYTPAENIINTLEFDPEMIKTELGGV